MESAVFLLYLAFALLYAFGLLSGFPARTGATLSLPPACCRA